MNIGTFTRTAEGYAGEVRVFGIREAITLVALARNDGESAPDFRIHLNDGSGAEVGFAWNEVGDKAGEYVSLKIVSPLVPGQSFRANLFRDDGEGETLTLSLNTPRRDDRS